MRLDAKMKGREGESWRGGMKGKKANEKKKEKMWFHQKNSDWMENEKRRRGRERNVF